MHSAFGQWYMKAGLAPDASELEHAAAIVDGFLKALTLESCKATLGTVLGGKTFAPAVLADLQGLASAADPTLDLGVQGIVRETLLRIAMRLIIESSDADDDAADFAALALSARGALLAIPEEMPSDTYLVSRERLSSRAREERDIPDIKLPDVPTATLKKQTDALAAATDVDTLKAAVTDYVLASNSAVLKFLTDMRPSMSTLARSQQVLAEESNIIGWLYLKQSRVENKLFSQIVPSAAHALAAWELFDLTQIAPGLETPEAFIHEVLRGNAKKKTTTIKTFVNELPKESKEWLKGKVSAQALDTGLLPICGAVSASLLTDDPNDWISVFAKASGIDASVSLPIESIAASLYSEFWLDSYL